MGENILSWNFPNWITIVLMASIGLALVSMGAQVYHGAKAANG